MGSLTLWSIGKRHFRKLERKDAGKPYAGKPHVRFDEGLETESETGTTARTHNTGWWESRRVRVGAGSPRPHWRKETEAAATTTSY